MNILPWQSKILPEYLGEERNTKNLDKGRENIVSSHE